MVKNKFTKFVIYYLFLDRSVIYAYYAVDEEAGAVLQIRPGGEFGTKIPASITGTVIENYKTANPEQIEEITEDQFWQVYKSYTLQLFQYYQEQTAPQIV